MSSNRIFQSNLTKYIDVISSQCKKNMISNCLSSDATAILRMRHRNGNTPQLRCEMKSHGIITVQHRITAASDRIMLKMLTHRRMIS